jgi:dynein heavy chain
MRKLFEDMLKEKVAEILPSLKEGESLFDYYLAMGEKGVEWKAIIPEKWKAPKEIFFSRLLMPTADSTRAHILVDLMSQNDQPVLFIGGSGTAKTSSVLMYANKFDNQKMLFHRINFSSATFPFHFQ